MKTLISLLLFVSTTGLAQSLLELHPKHITPLDFGASVQKEWAIRDRALAALENGSSYDQLSVAEKGAMEKYREVFESMWDIVGSACSWYCGFEGDEIIASSTLDSQGSNSYRGMNTHDLSYQTAWVEGVAGYGVGEYVEYIFPAATPRITEIIVVNGYVKTVSAWENNSRVKKLKVYYNDEAIAVLNLVDQLAAQVFSIGTLGYGDREELAKLRQKPSWKLRFEILEVYKGLKYDDTAITEIYFNGIDVHCLAKGTQITMADGSRKNIEWLKKGEEVISYNQGTGMFEPALIEALASPWHDKLVETVFVDGRRLIATADHPFFDGEHWFSYDPEKTMADYRYDNVRLLSPGLLFGDTQVKSVRKLDGPQRTFTIVRLNRNNVFIANGVFVGTEELRVSALVTTNQE